MVKKAEYRSSIRSKKLIRKAFMALLTEKDISKITVTDIVNRADINRSTFYAHYPDVRGLIEEIENNIIEKMKDLLAQFEFHTFFTNPTPILLQLSQYLQNDEEFYRILILANGADRFMEKLADVFMQYMKEDAEIPKEIRTSEMFEIRTCYFAGGVICVYKSWFLGQMNCTLNDIAIEVGRMIIAEAQNMNFTV
ncbi:MAG: TetR-like C-terminal domain-containing protein [Eubacteriales bacterium]